VVLPTDTDYFLILKTGRQQRVVGEKLRKWIGDSLVSAWLPQTVRGEKTFTDLARFQLGIEANGVKSKGSALHAAITIEGVQSVKDTIVSDNINLDGRYAGVSVNCPTKHNYVYLPSVATSKNWTYTIRKRDSTQYYVIVVFPDNSTFTIYYKKSILFINNGTEWERKS
jgi:hypothetical protein